MTLLPFSLKLLVEGGTIKTKGICFKSMFNYRYGISQKNDITCSCRAYAVSPQTEQSCAAPSSPYGSAPGPCTCARGSHCLPSPRSAGTPPPSSATRMGLHRSPATLKHRVIQGIHFKLKISIARVLFNF